VETVRQEKPDLILLDIMLPRMNGWEVCRILADAPDLCEIPIIVFTAKDSLEDRAQARQFNLAGFFTKPYATVDVVRHVDKVLTVQAEARARQRAS